jgi:hypothetical protein
MGDDVMRGTDGGAASDSLADTRRDVAPADSATMDLAKLRWALGACNAVRSQDKTRYVLNGVLVEHGASVLPDGVSGGTLRFVATDGHRAHIAEVYSHDVVAAGIFSAGEIMQGDAVALALKTLPKPKSGNARDWKPEDNHVVVRRCPHQTHRRREGGHSATAVWRARLRPGLAVDRHG